MQLSFRNNSAKIFYLLLATDVFFFLLHFLFQCKQYSYFGFCNKFSNQLFSISRDLGYAEFFQYIKEYWLVLLFAVLAWKNRSLLYSAWSLLFGYLLLDDSWRIHEKWGFLISNKLGFTAAFGLRAGDFGEMLVSAFFGSVFFILIALGYRLSNRTDKKISQSLIFLLLALAFFGIVTDAIDIMIKLEFLKHFMTFIEDGGEHIVISVIVWFVYDIFEQAHQKLPVSVNQSAIASPTQI